VNEGALRSLHRLKSQSLLLLIGREDSELSFMGLAEFWNILEELESLRRIWDMIIHVRSRIDVERRS
jgi:hypothetical protein